MSAEVKESTTITYNDDETVLTISVNEKPLLKYAFIKDSIPDSCKHCDFAPAMCEPIKCNWNERKDRAVGHYKIIESNDSLISTCKEFIKNFAKI